MGTAMNYSVPDRVKQSFVIFDIWALWPSRLSVRVSGCQKLRLNSDWHKMLYPCSNSGRQRVNNEINVTNATSDNKFIMFTLAESVVLCKSTC